MSACVAAAGAAQAGDLCQDFKTGKLMETPVLSQVMAQFSGVPIGVVASVLVYKLFDMAYTIGDPSGAAPAPSGRRRMDAVPVSLCEQQSGPSTGVSGVPDSTQV
eukprot:m.375633 g.375633  ORF g.375633 m.375633 type:complete len:105 (-) comp56181_c0_seq9:221-535(-)